MLFITRLARNYADRPILLSLPLTKTKRHRNRNAKRRHPRPRILRRGRLRRTRDQEVEERRQGGGIFPDRLRRGKYIVELLCFPSSFCLDACIAPEVSLLTSGCDFQNQCMFCKRKLSSQCEKTNSNKIANMMYGSRTAGMFGYSHFTGGFAGGQAEYARVPYGDVNLLKLPDSVPDEKGESKLFLVSFASPLSFRTFHPQQTSKRNVALIPSPSTSFFFSLRRPLPLRRDPHILELRRRHGREKGRRGGHLGRRTDRADGLRLRLHERGVAGDRDRRQLATGLDQGAISESRDGWTTVRSGKASR